MCACIHDTYVKKVDSRDNLGSKRMEGIMKGEEDLGTVICNKYEQSKKKYLCENSYLNSLFCY